MKEIKKTKSSYKELSDEIWKKRFNSPFLIRKHLHRTQYYTIINNLEKMLPKPRSVLDYGCGQGVLSVLLAKKKYDVTGLDISEPNIEFARNEAKKENLKINLISGDGENLPFDDNSFDIVVASHVLEHLPDMNKGISEIKRVSKKAVIAVPTCMSLCSLSLLGGDSPWTISLKTPYALPKGIIRLIGNIRNRGILENYAGKEEFPHPWYYPWKFKKILEDNGFQIHKIEAGSLILPYISYIIPQTIGFFKFIDRFRDKKMLCYLGYGTNYYVEVKK